MYKRIKKEDAKKLLNHSITILLDIRDPESYNNGHAKNAIHFEQSDISDFISKTDKSNTILIMCYHGNSSQILADYLAGQGFLNVYSIDGGYQEWIQ